MAISIKTSSRTLDFFNQWSLRFDNTPIKTGRYFFYVVCAYLSWQLFKFGTFFVSAAVLGIGVARIGTDLGFALLRDVPIEYFTLGEVAVAMAIGIPLAAILASPLYISSLVEKLRVEIYDDIDRAQ